MSDPATPGRVRAYLASRKNTAGLAGALSGPVLALTGVLDTSWPAVSVGAYAVLALLVVNPEPPPAAEPPPPPLIPSLRADADRIRARLDHQQLPPAVPRAVRRILDVLAPVLDRLDQEAATPQDRVELPRRLADVSSMIREDLPACLDLYLGRGPTTPQRRAAGELARQLALIADAADRLAAEVPDTGVLRAEELTDELRRRYPPDPAR